MIWFIVFGPLILRAFLLYHINALVVHQNKKKKNKKKENLPLSAIKWKDISAYLLLPPYITERAARVAGFAAHCIYRCSFIKRCTLNIFLQVQTF